MFPDEAELDREPEHACQRFHECRRRLQRRLPVGLQEVCEDGIGMERYMPEDVMEDVGFGQVLEGLPGTDDDRGRELPATEAGEEGDRLQVPRR